MIWARITLIDWDFWKEYIYKYKMSNTPKYWTSCIFAEKTLLRPSFDISELPWRGPFSEIALARAFTEPDRCFPRMLMRVRIKCSGVFGH